MRTLKFLLPTTVLCGGLSLFLLAQGENETEDHGRIGALDGDGVLETSLEANQDLLKDPSNMSEVQYVRASQILTILEDRANRILLNHMYTVKRFRPGLKPRCLRGQEKSASRFRWRR